jgi:hypothetical protein
MARPHWYVGCNAGMKRDLFTADQTPTFATHGGQFAAVIGPFRTKRGALFMAQYGNGNPHCQCVADAERLGKKYAHNLA